MAPNTNPSFEFNNQISPRYVDSLLMQIEPERWYSTSELQLVLQRGGLDIQGRDIVLLNVRAWALIGLGVTRIVKQGRSNVRLFRLGKFGRYARDLYSTNPALFFDLIHYRFYTAWPTTERLEFARFWLYWRVCDELWQTAPSSMDSFGLTNRLQQESHVSFPDLKPSFPERSVRGTFPWLVALSPPFLFKVDGKGTLRSSRRSHCSPQLFHLATDLVLREERLKYGTAMTIGESQIEATCRMCLLDPERYWSMAELTELSIRGFGLKRSQWGRSIILSGPPSWIDLPNLTISDDVDVIGDTEEDA
jgi:hypothetical protein